MGQKEHAEKQSTASEELERPLLGEEGGANDFCPAGVSSRTAEDEIQRNKHASTLPESAPPVHGQSGPSAAGYHEGYHLPQVHQHVIIVHNTPIPTVVCPFCHRTGPTIQYKSSGFCTWFTASLCCFVGCCILFPFVFCCDTLKDTVHYCSHCRRYLGRTPA